jgi:hypothetical protein
LATLTLILATVSKAVVSDCGARTLAHEAGALHLVRSLNGAQTTVYKTVVGVLRGQKPIPSVMTPT